MTDEAQQLADRVAIMRGGEIIALGSPDEIGGRDARPAEIRFSPPARTGLDDPPLMPYERFVIDGGRALVVSHDPVVALQLLTGWAIDHELTLAHLSVSQPSLEDIYLELTGRSAGARAPEEVLA
jgi:ABC-2 type transport system ATP-binding protein